MATGQLIPLIHYLRRVASSESDPHADGRLLAAFAADRDESAFAALVRRHGPMVLGVCRRVLHDWHAAEDAFQATFLVLARKAGSLSRPELLANWLHGVAYRTAVRARTEAVRRRTREKRAPVPVAVAPADGPDWDDLRPVLDEEVNRLPARYRVPFVLCYLEDHTNAEAARRLGCSRGTVATLLARARERLRRRLTRRGVAPAALLAATLTPRGEAVSAALETATARAAALFAAGTSSAPAAPLAIGVMRAMLTTRLKVAAAVLLAISVVAAGAGLSAYRAGAQEVVTLQARAKPAPQPPLAGEEPPPPPLVAVPPPAVEADGPASYRTPNFVVSAPTPAVAEQVGRAAEHHRKEQALRWLGKEMPEWPKPCPVRVKITVNGVGGATSFAFDKGMVLSQDMHLEGPLDRILSDALPHEVTHTVLAHWYGKPVPRWADEGVALLSESTTSRDRHQRMMRRILGEGRRIPLRQLLPSHEFPKDVMILYTEGYSLTYFLLKAGSRRRFLTFVRQGESDGWDEAVRVYYRWRTVEEMEKAWLASVSKAGLRDAEVTWRRDYQKARREASEKERPLFLYFARADGPNCKQLDQRTFKDPEVADLLNDQFIPVRIDAERTPKLAEAMNIKVYPTLVVARPDGAIRINKEGFVEAGALKKLLQKVLDALNRGQWEPFFTRSVPVVEEKPRGRMPAGPAPVQVLARLGSDGQLRVWQTTTAYQASRQITGEGTAVTTYQPVTVVRAARYKLDDIRAHDVKGKAIDPKKLRTLLKEETTVLAAADGRPVDPLHLRLYREDTLVLLLPVPIPPAPAAVPPPAPATDIPLTTSR